MIYMTVRNEFTPSHSSSPIDTAKQLGNRDVGDDPQHAMPAGEYPWCPDAIYEVVTVPAQDDLPYVFEMSRGQQLRFSLAATGKLGISICDEDTYDRWLEAGMPIDEPDGLIPIPQGSRQHALFYRAPSEGVFLAVLVNPGDTPVDVAVAAAVSA